MLIYGDESRSASNNNKYFSLLCSYVDEISRTLKFKSAHFAAPYSMVVGRKALEKTFTINYVYFYYHSLSFLKKLLLTNKSKLNLNDANFKSRAFQVVLKRVAPKIIMGIHLPAPLVLAAKKLNIPTLEILHGIGHYQVIREWRMAHDPYLLPDGVLAFDQKSLSTYSEYKKKRIFLVGLPHPLDQKIKCKYDNMIFKEIRLTEGASRKKKIIFSLQVGKRLAQFSSMDEIVGSMLTVEMLEAIKLTQDTVDWHFKFHPIQLIKPQYKSQLDLIRKLADSLDNVFYNFVNLHNPSQYLDQFDGHITIRSMFSYECASVGVPTLALSRSLGDCADILDDIEKDQYVVFGKNNRHFICNWIESISQLKSRPISDGIQIDDFNSGIRKVMMLN